MTAFVEAGLSNVLASAALALVAIAVGLVCRRPAVAHALWLLVLLKLVTPPLFRVPLPWPAPAPEREVASAPTPQPPPALAEEVDVVVADWPDQGEPADGAEAEADAGAAPPEVETPPAPLAPGPARPGTGWQALIGTVWLAGSAAWFALALRRAWRFTLALRHAKPAPPRLQARVEELARQVGLARAPQVRLVPGRVPPLVWAVGRPLVLLPEGLLRQVSAQGLDTLLVHELAHLRRRDHWWRWLETAALGLFWWDPLAWYARQQMREAEEQCCDAWVVTALPQARRAYASALVDALDFLSPAEPPPPLATGVGQVADLKRRLTMIMRGDPSPRLGLLSGLAVLALTGLLPLTPGWATRADDAPPKKDEVIIKREGGDVLRARGAQDDVEKIEADLRARVAEIEAVKRKLEIARQEAIKKKVEAALKARGVELPKGGQPGLTVRVEISGVSQAEAKAVVEAVQKVVPAGKDKKVLLTIDGKAAAGPKGPIHAAGGDKDKVIIRWIDSKTGKVIREEQDAAWKWSPRAVEPKKGLFGPGAPMRPAPPKEPPAPKGPGAPRGPGGDRMDRLEKQLDSVIRELSELRRQMGRPGPGGPGGRGGPGAGGPGGPGGGRGGAGGGGDRRPGPNDPVAPRSESR